MTRTLSIIQFLTILFFSTNATSVDISENVLSLGLQENIIRSNLGPPSSIKHEIPDEITGMNQTKLLQYNGAKLDFHLSPNGFYLWRLELTSNKYSYSNKRVKVGVNSEEILKVFGQPSSKEVSGEVIAWLYQIKGFDGWIRIKLINNVVVSIMATEDWT